jgi:hypothetical protein
VKISDIIQETLTKPSPNITQSSKVVGSEVKFPNMSILGRPGVQATAYRVGNQAGRDEVVKVVNISGTADPVYQFLRLILNHQDNPHFPKIHSIKKYNKYSNSKIGQLIITMERLLPIPRNDQFLCGLFGVDPKVVDLTTDNVDMWFEEPKDRMEILKATNIPTLKRAIRLIEPLFNNYTPDMHMGNLMYRQSSGGPTLVFLDPVTGSLSFM